MSIMINSEVSKQYLLTDDAVEGFRLAVENGQIRLALQVLVDVVDGIMEIFDSAFEEEEPVQEESKAVEVLQKEEAPVKEEPAAVEEEKKEPSKKATKDKVENTVAS